MRKVNKAHHRSWMERKRKGGEKNYNILRTNKETEQGERPQQRRRKEDK